MNSVLRGHGGPATANPSCAAGARGPEGRRRAARHELARGRAPLRALVAVLVCAAGALACPSIVAADHQAPAAGTSPAYGVTPVHFGQTPDGRPTGLSDWELAELARNHMAHVRGNLVFEDVYPRDPLGSPSVDPQGIVDTADPNVLAPDWTRSDGVMCRLSRHGVSWSPVLTLRGAAGGALLASSAPDDAVERLYFRRFATHAARRYGPGGEFWRDPRRICSGHGLPGPFRETPISAWEVWNEPNSDAFWSTPAVGGPNATEYRLLLQAAREGIKRYGNAGARVLFGGLAADGTARAFYRAATGGDAFARDCLSDAVAVHAYGPDAGAAAGHVLAMRAEMSALGHHDRPLWVNEWGWTTGSTADRHFARPDASEAAQAAQVGAFLDWVTRSRAALNLGPVQYFGFRDEPSRYAGGEKPFAYMGLVAAGLNADGSFTRAKPGYHVYAGYTNAAPLIPLPPLRCPGRWS